MSPRRAKTPGVTPCARRNARLKAASPPAKVELADRVESMKVSRTQLARVLAEAVGRVDWHGQTLSVSG